eukprot:1969949-Rhodomonas_salina.1
MMLLYFSENPSTAFPSHNGRERAHKNGAASAKSASNRTTTSHLHQAWDPAKGQSIRALEG